MNPGTLGAAGNAARLERRERIPISGMVRVLLASAALLGICGCGQGAGRGADGGLPEVGGPRPDGGYPDGSVPDCGSDGGLPACGPPVDPEMPGIVEVAVVDVFGTPQVGAWISLHSNSPYQQAMTDTEGRATFTSIRPGAVDASATTFDDSYGYGYGSSSLAVLASNGHANLHIILRPYADSVFGSTVAAVDPGGLSADGRSLTFRFGLRYVDGSRRVDIDVPMSMLPLEVSLADCVPDDGNDSPIFTSDCVGGTSGFDAAYRVVEPPAPFEFRASRAAGLSQQFSAALLLDQSEHIQLRDPGDTRLFGTKYFLVQNRVTDHLLLAGFGADDASTGELSPLPQQPVTTFPVQNGTSSFSTVESLANLEGGVAPLYAAIDEMLDLVAANETAVGQRRMVVVVTDGRDDTCGSEAECRDARAAVAEKSRATVIELVTIGLADGATEDRRALSELTAASGGRSFWVFDRTQLAMLLGALPDVLSYGGETLAVSFKLQASTAGTFQSGRTVFATVVLNQCFDWYCWGGPIPIAVRIP